MTLQDIPTSMRNLLSSLRNEFEALSSYGLNITDDQLVQIFNSHTPSTLSDFSQMAWNMGMVPDNYKAGWPWLQYGIDRDQYNSLSQTYATEYKKLTGQDIPADELQKAFQGVSGSTAGTALLTGSEYTQRLMNDQNIQKTYGWVKYGMDYNQLQQQKLQMRSLFGRDLSDQEATTQLAYLHAAQGGNHEVTAQTQQSQDQRKQAAQGVSGSVIR